LTWTNEIVGGDAEERAVVIGVMNALGYAFNAWVPVLTYPQTDAPRFSTGWKWSCVAFTLQIIVTWVIYWLWKRDLGQRAFKWRRNGTQA
jgi:MFS transporter, ACS family, pantothenate transporter